MRQHPRVSAILGACMITLAGCSDYRANENVYDDTAAEREARRDRADAERRTDVTREQTRTEYRDDTRGTRTTTSERTDVVRETEPDFPNDSPGTIDRFRKVDPSLAKFFDGSYGYAVFPKISKGAVGVGAAGGHGDVYEQGRRVGTAKMSQVTVGAQVGGQTYSEIIFFKDKANFEVFKQGNTEFAANASATIAESGAGATNDFREGIAVFIMTRAGAMVEAAIGGQDFVYYPD